MVIDTTDLQLTSNPPYCCIRASAWDTTHVQMLSCWNCVKHNNWCRQKTRNRNTSWKGFTWQHIRALLITTQLPHCHDHKATPAIMITHTVQLPYSGKLSREKTFVKFSPLKVFRYPLYGIPVVSSPTPPARRGLGDIQIHSLLYG